MKSCIVFKHSPAWEEGHRVPGAVRTPPEWGSAASVHQLLPHVGLSLVQQNKDLRLSH